jgi:hypothetical protein
VSGHVVLQDWEHEWTGYAFTGIRRMHFWM